jgi:penicillin V acylase-like amidase (Ntn superfamily)
MTKRSVQIPRTLVTAVVLLLTLQFPAYPCSRVLWNRGGQTVVAGRSMDWRYPLPVNLWLLPRGIVRDGMTGKNTLKWSARYGSVVAADFIVSDGVSEEGFVADGMNEKGLAAHALWLSESDYGARDETLPGLSIGLWTQYFLDNFRTVSEAVEFVQKTPFQIVAILEQALHLVIEDATGDSAVIEYVGAKAKIYHGREYTVATNSPTLDKQIKRLRKYETFGGKKPLPGTTEPEDRFVRGVYYLKTLPQPADWWQSVTGILSVIRNLSQPFGEADPSQPDISPTQWRTISDLTDLTYYFESTTSPNIIWIRLNQPDFSPGAPVKKLDLINNPIRVGDTLNQFETAQPFVVPPVDGI